MRFFLGRTEVRITPGAVLLPAFCIVAGETRALLFAILSLSVHEAAHAVAAKNLGIPLARLTVYPFGAVLTPDSLLCDGRGEGIVAAAGPLGSLMFAALLRLFDAILPGGEWIERLIGTNLVIAFLNLLPAFPLDGGRIFRALLSHTVRERTARIVLLSFTAAIALGMTGVGLICVVRGVPAWTLFLIPPFLIASAIKEWRMPDAGIITRVLERGEAVRSGVPRTAKIVVIGENASIKDALSCFSGSRYTILRVLGGAGFRELTETEILRAAAHNGPEKSLKSVILQLTDGK